MPIEPTKPKTGFLMELNSEQISKLRKPFDKIGAFNNYSDEEVENMLNNIANFYRTLADINLRIKKNERPN